MTANPFPRAAYQLAMLAIIGLATSLVWFRLQFPAIGIDDANIFFVYARNISAGEGFVFNAGGDRVEGFTSLMWVLICTAAVIVVGNPERLLLLLSVLLVALTVGCCCRSFICRRTSDPNARSPLWTSIFVILLASDFRYVMWNTVTLMETALWGCVLTLSALLVVDDSRDRRQTWRLASLVALMVVTRPEALVWAPTVLGLFYIAHAARAEHTSAWRRVLPALLSFLLTAALLTIFRSLYFGYPLPNTYYAKVSPSWEFNLREGATYLWSYVLSGLIPFASGLAIVVSIGHILRVKFRDTRTLTLTVLAVVGLIVPVLTGGDHFDGFRFYQSVYPILLLVLLNCVRFIIPQYFTVRLRRRVPRPIVLAGTAALIGIYVVVQVVDWVQFQEGTLMRNEFEIAELGRERGATAEKLFAAFKSRPSIATMTVGGLKYAYGGDVIDLMGLNNTRMAHNGGGRVGFRSHAAFEKHTFYELRPMMIIPHVQYADGLSQLSRRVPFVDLVLKGLLDEKDFRGKYRLAEVRKATAGGVVAVAAWYEREFLDYLGRANEFQVRLLKEP